MMKLKRVKKKQNKKKSERLKKKTYKGQIPQVNENNKKNRDHDDPKWKSKIINGKKSFLLSIIMHTETYNDK